MIAYAFVQHNGLLDYYNESRTKNTQRHGQTDAITSTEFNAGNTQYESLTEGHTRDGSPHQG